MQISGTIRPIPGKTTAVLRVGDIVHLTVRRTNRAEHLVLKGKTLHVTVQANPALHAGDRLTARILATHPRLRLEVVPEKGVTRSGSARLSSAVGDRSEALKNILTHALENSGHGNDETRFRHVVALYRRYFGLPRDGERKKVQLSRARSMVELADRALDRTREDRHDQVSDLVQWFSGTGNRRNDGRKEAAHGTSTDTIDGPDDLVEYLQRATETPDHLLQLFNALRPSGDLHWVIVPIRGWRSNSSSASAQNTVDAVLKIGWLWKEHTPVEALLSVTGESGACWWFRWTIAKKGKSTVVEPQNAWSEDSNAHRPVDVELLARLGFSGHTGDVKQKVECDGFTSSTSKEGKELRIDTYG